ncbi:MAG: hypothetical protein BGN97_11355 [Microbacterium sp. 69-10]|uniref:hypothetical protein n=1 Tax=Microbacterium sp. 69-10 TaxID=1895783 RepID=UPI00095E88C6|nr:hypothetical protein [Microbacterium sp. 69-10]OJU40431.1 MAG: hypothetical protein BGN97_11355 [Microbacterium sp. 69-10]
MLEGAEAARRRELQLRAYAPGGALTDAEAAELRDLDARNLTAPVVSPPITEPTSARDDGFRASALWAGSSTRTESPAEHAETPDVSESKNVLPDEAPAAGRTTMSLRRFPRRILLPVVAVFAIVVGLVAGRAIFSDHGPVMTAEQQDTWARLQSTTQYDAGSVELVGSKDGVDVWKATQNDGASDCLLLTRGRGSPGLPGGTGVNCLNPKTASGETLGASLTYVEKGVEYSVWASSAEDINGNPFIAVQRESMSEEWDWRVQYDEAELKTISAIEATGMDGQTLSILGYDGDTPVWLGFDSEPCIVIVQPHDVVTKKCGNLSIGSPPLELTVGDSTYSVLAGDMNSPGSGNVLTIYRAGGAAGGQG